MWESLTKPYYYNLLDLIIERTRQQQIFGKTKKYEKYQRSIYAFW